MFLTFLPPILATQAGPAITSQPSSVTCFEDDSGLTMSIVSAEADNFQWQKKRGGVGDWLNISGATSATWNISTAIPTVTAGDTVRCRAGIGSAYSYSSEVTLKIWPNFPITPHSWWHGVGAAFFEERTAGGSTASSVGGVVGTWRDRSGNSRHFVATSDTARPLLQSDGSLLFDGVNAAMQAATAATWAFLNNGTANAIFIVAEVVDADPESFQILIGTRATGAIAGFYLGHDTRSSVPRSNQLLYQSNGSGGATSALVIQPTDTTLTEQAFLAAVRADSDAETIERAVLTTDWEQWPSAYNSTSASTSAADPGNPLTIGASANGSAVLQNFAKIKVREIAIFSGTMTDGVYDTIRLQLMERHGIAYTKRTEDELFGLTGRVESNDLTLGYYSLVADGSNPYIASNALDYGTDINYATILREAQDSYKFWYGAYDKTSSPKKTRVAYAASDDGLSLDAVALNLITINGNTNNNCIGADGWWNLSVWREKVGGKYVGCLEETDGIASGSGYGRVYDSSDGLTWTLAKDLSSLVGSYFENKEIIQRNDGRWLVYYVIGHSSQDREIHAFLSNTSDYTGTWVNLGAVLSTSSQDDQKYSFRVFHSGTLLYAAVAAYNKTAETMDQDLYVSVDGIRWTKLVDSWIPLGSGGSWNDGMIVGHCCSYKDGDDWRHYATGSDILHNVTTDGNNSIGIWRSPYRGLRGAAGTGDLISTTRAPSESNLWISCAVTTSLKVELLDGITGEVLDGYSADDCDAITTGVQEVTWGGLSSPGGLLKVKLVAVSATVYSYWFGEVGL